MKVKKTDLKGEISDFPIGIVQRMCECQVHQGNEFNPKIFQKNIKASKTDYGSKGFDWDKTTEKHDFWWHVIATRNFDIFFEKYPKVSKDIAIKLEEIERQGETKYICKISFILDYEVEGHSKEIMNKNLKRKLKQIYEHNKIK